MFSKLLKHLYNFLSTFDLSHHIILSGLLHLVLIAYGEVHDRYFEVKYTDIDYTIFTDAAQFVCNGSSPFDRATYRYTPILAWLMTPNLLAFRQFGKLLFSLFDILSGYTYYQILPSRINRKLYVFLWLYNPLPLIISTRGSSESVICFLLSLVLYLLDRKQHSLAGLFYGFTIHFKLYPIIYIFSLYLGMILFGYRFWHDILRVCFCFASSTIFKQ